MRTALAAAALLALTAAPALAADPAPGKTVEVVCKDAPDQKYACYVPKAYDAARKWPILYCFSPNANGDSFVQRYRDVCEERGWIVVGSMNSRNGPWEPIKAAVAAMWADTAVRFNLSDEMRYTSGFSGGSRVSFAVAEMHKPKVAGVIGIGAGLPDAKMPRKGLAAFLMCGEKDFNKRELDPLSKRLEEAGNPVQYENFPGEHVMPPTPLMEKAVRWLDDLAPARKAAQFRATLDEAKVLAEGGDNVAAWRALADLLDGGPDVKKDLRKEAETLRKRLERLPAVKPEAQARNLYVSALAWLEKNAERVAGFPSARKQAVKKFRAVAKRYPDTGAGEAAAAKAAELAALAD